ncbi:Ribosomal protein L22/L17 [Trinorchestia longiramus]|nr:Ribosomal protein L22/L17 [Trinorchestia longiramus]
MNYTRTLLSSIVKGSRSVYAGGSYSESAFATTRQPQCLPWRAGTHVSQLHASALLSASGDPIYSKYDPDVSVFHRHNLKKYPPLEPGEAPRHAFVCHEKRNIRYYPKKMQVVAKFIRGMTIDDAINQLKFCPMKGAVDVLETILEAQKMAVEEHNVEFPSNLWVSESFCLPDQVIKTMRRHSKARVGIIRHRFVHYCCTLEEGKPPKHYYHDTRPLEPHEHIQQWLKEKRERHVPLSI